MSSYNAKPNNLSVGNGSSALPSRGLAPFLNNEELDEANDVMDMLDLDDDGDFSQEPELDQLAAYIRDTFYEFRQERDSSGLTQRMLDGLRAYRGEYTAEKEAEISSFGGSTVYARLTALKCRGATSMLRDIYLAGERPWFLMSTPVPTLPADVTQSIMELVKVELANQASGQGPEPSMGQVQDRLRQLTRGAERAAKQQAEDEAKRATQHLDDMLVEGKFYESFVAFLHHLTVSPYAVMKGPVVKIATDVAWVAGRATVEHKPKLFWTTPNPFDIYWSMGSSSFEDAIIIERMRLSRTDLNNLIGVKGFNEKAIREVLDVFGSGGLTDWLDYSDSERAELETREDPHGNESNMIDALEFTGNLQGHMLLEYGMSEEDVPDPTLDYFCTAWLIDRYVIKVQIDPNPRKRHPYYKTSFEKIPGGIVGHGIPEILTDIQDVANATLRSLVNNLAIASGPQVVINDDRVSPNTDTDDLYPWKRWHVLNDPMASNEPAVTFYQPDSRSSEMLQVYHQMTVMADEISSIPRYMTGSASAQGGAGRTASGLSMLMENAGKVMQSVAANIDADIFSPLLQRLYDTVMLAEGDQNLRGDEQIQVRGVVFAHQKETERARLLEFLSLTANPLDAEIVGQEGRAELLRETAERIGLDHMQIVPDKETLKANVAKAQMAAMAQQGDAEKAPAEAGRPEEGLRASMAGPSGKTV